MTDVLKIALDRRAELHEEVARLDEFIRMAEALIRTSQARQSDTERAAMPAAEPHSPLVERPAAIDGEASVRTAMRRAEVGGMQVNAEVSRPAVIRRGQAAG